MKRLGLKFVIGTLLTLLSVLLVLERLPKGQQGLLQGVAIDAALPIREELRQALQESLRGASDRSPLGDVATPHLPPSLPRDPFAFALPSDAQRHRQQAGAGGQMGALDEPPVEENLRLKATSIDQYGAMAFINDEVLTEGQSILGYTIVRIAAGYVELSRDGVMRYLHLEDGTKP